MRKLVRIGVKFCGSCNPQISTGEIFRRIKEKLAGEGVAVEFAAPDAPAVAALLVISGCPSDCAERPAGGLPEVVVGGETVNRVECGAVQVPAAAVAALAELLSGAER